MNGYFGFVKHQWAALAFGFLAVFCGNVGQTFFLGQFSEAIQSSLELSASGYGFIYALATLASAATVVWAGSLIDHLPLKTYTLLACGGLCVAAFAMSQANHWAGLLLAFFGLRLFGQALLPHGGSTTMARIFDSHRGKALSIASSGFPAGEVILPAVAVALLASIGWQSTWLGIAAVIALLVAPSLLFLIRRAGIGTLEQSQTHGQSRHKSARARKALLTDRRYWLALPGLMAGPFVATGIFIHQDFVIASKGWTPAWFATCFAIFGVVHWLSTMIAGWLVDRVSAVKLLPLYQLPMALALLLLAFVPGDWVGVVFMTLLACSIGSSPPIAGSLWPEIYGVNYLGAVRSINIAVMVFATSLSPALYGSAIDHGIPLASLMAITALYVLLACGLLALSYTANPARHTIAAD